MQRLSAVLALLLVACASTPATQTDDRYPNMTGAFEAHLALRDLDDDTYGQTDDQLGLGLSLQVRPPSWPTNLDVGLIFTSDSDGHHDYYDYDVESSNVELSVGILERFGTEFDPVRFYLGGGAALVFAEYEDDDEDINEDDSTVGLYVRGGVMFLAFQRSYWGIDVRTLQGAELDLGLDDDDGNYVQVGLYWGTHF